MAERNEDLALLRERLVTYFDTSELQTLCFDMGVDYEELAGTGATKSALARNLIAYLARRGMLTELINICERVRPHVLWGSVTGGSDQLPPTSGVEESEYGRYLSVFLCHSSSDKPVVRQLYHQLKDDGFDPWLDAENLLPGQDWQLEITKALRASDVIIVCSSKDSVSKSGYVQKEIKFALDRALEQPEGAIFVIPLKLQECDLPNSLSKYQWVKYFDDDGYQQLLRALRSRAASLGIRPGPSFGYKDR